MSLVSWSYETVNAARTWGERKTRFGVGVATTGVAVGVAEASDEVSRPIEKKAMAITRMATIAIGTTPLPREFTTTLLSCKNRSTPIDGLRVT
jgi:hypothetical protein